MEPKDKFKNTSTGVAGAIQLDHENKAKGVPVYPGESIWLSETEQALTAEAPRNEEDNPFTNGTFTLEVRGGEGQHARPIGRDQSEAADAGAPAAPSDDPENIDIREEQPAANEPPPGPPEGETGAADPPTGAAPAGQPVVHEEVAAVEQPAPPAPSEQPAAKPAPKPLAPPPATD